MISSGIPTRKKDTILCPTSRSVSALISRARVGVATGCRATAGCQQSRSSTHREACECDRRRSPTRNAPSHCFSRHLPALGRNGYVSGARRGIVYVNAIGACRRCRAHRAQLFRPAAFLEEDTDEVDRERLWDQNTHTTSRQSNRTRLQLRVNGGVVGRRQRRFDPRASDNFTHAVSADHVELLQR